jgi:hypothetical protein
MGDSKMAALTQRDCGRSSGLSGSVPVLREYIIIPRKGAWCKQWACVTGLVVGGGDRAAPWGAYFVSEVLHAVITGAAELELPG